MFLACCKKGSRKAFTKIQFLTQSAALSKASLKLRTRRFFFFNCFFFPQQKFKPKRILPTLSCCSSSAGASLGLSMPGQWGQADMGQGEALSLCPGVCSQRWDTEGKAFTPLAGICGLSMGFGGQFFCSFGLVFFKPGQISLHYLELYSTQVLL